MIKEYNGSTWNTKSYAKVIDTTQQVASFPVVVRPMENTIPSWTIKGNMSQSGTPSPSSIIMPSECGDMTSNLFDKNAATIGYYVSSSTGDLVQNTLSMASDYIPVEQGQQYYWNDPTIRGNAGAFYDSNKTYISGWNSSSTRNVFTAPNGASYVRLTAAANNIDNLQLNTGSTALPYQPNGYKLDIKSGNTTTPVYLGEVESTRQIKKLVLTGQENFNTYSTIGQYSYTLNTAIVSKTGICSHYILKPEYGGAKPYIRIASNSIWFELDATGYSTTEALLADFKAYLAAQYAAGTPVTVWYVLATPTTGIVNEPLRKIGTYSDSVSGTNLSVTAQSPTTIDVDTSLKPSEMDLTYTGLKMCKRKKRVNGAWV